MTLPVTVLLFVNVAPLVTVVVRLPLLTRVPAVTPVAVNEFVPLRVSVLAPACDMPAPVMLLEIEIAWPALALLTRLGPAPLKFTA